MVAGPLVHAWALRRLNVLSTGPSDCGPAALASIARHAGLAITLSEVRELVGGGLYGTTLQQLKSGGERLGFDVSIGQAKREVLNQVPLPAIAHFSGAPFGHYVVVYSCSRDKVVIGDPAAGIRRLTRAEFDRRWSGRLLLARLAVQPKAVPQLRETTLLDLFRGQGQGILTAFAIAMLTLLTSIGLASLLRSFVNVAAVASVGAVSWSVFIGIVSLFVTRAVLHYVRGVHLIRLARRLEVSLGSQYLGALLRARLRNLEQLFSGDLYSRLSETQSIRQAVAGIGLLTASDLSVTLLGCVALAFYSWPLAAFGVAGVIVAGSLALIFVPSERKVDRRVREALSALANEFMEVMASIRVVKAYHAEEACALRLAGLQNEAVDARLSVERLAVKNTLAAGIVTSALGLAIAVLSLGFGQGVGYQLGEWAFVYSLVGVVLASAAQLGPAVRFVADATTAWTRVSEIVALGASVPKPKASPATGGDLPGYELQSATFSYDNGKPVIEDVTCTFPAAGMVAIVGPTGCGKSTLAAILSGMYHVQSGSVSWRGENLDGRRPEKRNDVTIVFQDPLLMKGTIRENISLGLDDLSEEEVTHAATIASVTEFSDLLPRGLDSQIGPRGGLLSSGQRQRIALARAVVRKPAVLILDEATCALDPATEQDVLKAIHQDCPGSLLIYITHRLSAVQTADLIVCMRAGRIVEIGRHADLKSSRGEYARLLGASSPPPPECQHGMG